MLFVLSWSCTHILNEQRLSQPRPITGRICQRRRADLVVEVATISNLDEERQSTRILRLVAARNAYSARSAIQEPRRRGAREVARLKVWHEPSTGKIAMTNLGKLIRFPFGPVRRRRHRCPARASEATPPASEATIAYVSPVTHVAPITRATRATLTIAIPDAIALTRILETSGAVFRKYPPHWPPS